VPGWWNLVVDYKNYTDEDIKKAVENSFNWTQVIRLLGLRPAGGTHKNIQRKVEKLGIDVSHFKMGLPLREKYKISIKDLLKSNVCIRSSHLKKRIIKEGVLEYRCSVCSQGPVWNGKPMVLELDHIDGDIYNNKIENLRIICLHCHSQTSTFRRKKIVKSKVEKIYCKKCGKEISKSSIHKMCSSCFNKNRKHSIGCRKVKNRPSVDVLVKEVIEMGYTGTGRKYGVSDNSIRKWIKNGKKIG